MHFEETKLDASEEFVLEMNAEETVDAHACEQNTRQFSMRLVNESLGSMATFRQLRTRVTRHYDTRDEITRRLNSTDFFTIHIGILYLPFS
jgi:hypothetical protein